MILRKIPSRTWVHVGAALSLVFSLQIAEPTMAELRGFTDVKEFSPKEELIVQSEGSISRRRVIISQTVTERKSPVLSNLEDVEFERARKYKIDEKTSQLIKQLEALIQRPGQQTRVGELKMRLAELYYERGQAIAAQESEDWETRIKSWEALPEEEKSKKARPILQTPKADNYRKRTLNLYADLERSSRGSDKGKSQSIRRDEVLYFYASTLMDLGRRKEALPLYEDLVRDYPSGERIFSARMNLADLNFEMGRYDRAVPLYLEVAAGRGAPSGEDADHLKSYALYKLGWCYMNMAQYDKAVLAFRRTVEKAKASSNDRRIVLEKEALFDLARAFALAGQFDEGESFYTSMGSDGEEAFDRFRHESASIARDNGRLDIAMRFYGQLLNKDPNSEQARDYAMERLQLSAKRGNVSEYQKELGEFAKSYGVGSSWMSARNEDTQKVMSEELVSMLRREAKNTHRNAQQKDKPELYKTARGYYDLYFQYVPSPNPDTAANVHEMRFYQAELYFKLGMHKEAAEAYDVVGDGKYSSQASYARILALKQGAKSDKEMSKILIEATDEFVEQFPQDERSGDLLYSSAQEAFNTGDNKQSIVALEKVLTRFAGKSTGAEAAERILFIHEKEGDLDAAALKSEEFLKNKELVKAGGPDFEKRLREISERAEFKKTESLEGDDALKAQGFLTIAQKSRGEIKEKALNNAIVFAKKSNAQDTLFKAQKMMIDEFPNSTFAKGIYFEMGESAAKNAKWSEATKSYSAFLKSFGDKKNSETEAAEWNKLFIVASLEDVWTVELFPQKSPSAEVMNLSWNFIEKYPRSKNRVRLIEMIAFRKNSSEGDLAKLKKIPSLNSEELEVIRSAETVHKVRSNEGIEALVKRVPPSKASTPVLKHALALSSFRVIEPRYKGYLQQKIDYTPKSFGKTLTAKIGALEKLEKEYMGVVAYGNGEWALKSLERLSVLYRTLAADIDKAPGVPKEDLAQFSKPIYDKGVGFLKTCLDKGTELKIGGEGLALCRSSASKIGASFVTLTDDILPKPKWLPNFDAASSPPLLKAQLEALKKSRFGEAQLAQELLAKEEGTLSADDVALLELMKGLVAHNDKAYDSATRSFRKATEVNTPSVKAAAYKNLAALYLEVSDFSQAKDAASSLGNSDADSAFLNALAARGLGDQPTALSHYEAGLALAPNNEDILFNISLVHASLGNMDKAAVTMTRFIEMKQPSANDISRELLKRYKAQGGK